MGGYGAREVAKMLGLSVSEVRAYVRAGFLEPTRGPRGALRFSFQDLVLLRTAKGLVSARIAPRRVRSALRKLKEQLPEGRPLRGVHIRAVGDRIVVGDGDASWRPKTCACPTRRSSPTAPRSRLTRVARTRTTTSRSSTRRAVKGRRRCATCARTASWCRREGARRDERVQLRGVARKLLSGGPS